MRRMDALSTVPTPVNEPNLDYAPGSAERAALEQQLVELQKAEVELTGHGRRRAPDGARARSSTVVQPHNHQSRLGVTRGATAADAKAAIKAAGDAAPAWRAMSFEDRASIILKAADLLAGPWRSTINAATMLGQSKTAWQAEIDAACELIDFWRFNVHYARADPARAADRQLQGHLEPHRPPAARRFRLRDHAVQLHGDRRQPARPRRR